MTTLSRCQIKWEIVSNFVAFLENLNFNDLIFVSISFVRSMILEVNEAISTIRQYLNDLTKLSILSVNGFHDLHRICSYRIQGRWNQVCREARGGCPLQILGDLEAVSCTLIYRMIIRYLSRFFDCWAHETTYAYIGKKHFFTKSCHRQTYQNSKISWQKNVLNFTNKGL